MKSWLLSGMLLMGVLAAPAVMAQTVNLDMDPSTEVIDESIEVAPNETFDVFLVIQGANDMTGVSVDIAFDATNVLTLLGVKEVPGDLDFSGDLQLSEEVLAVINQFICEFNFECTFDEFRDGHVQVSTGEGRASGVVYDQNGNQQTDLDEVLEIINEFIDEFNFAGTAYWTREMKQAAAAGEFAESVEIFDPPANSNVGGNGTVGLIDDITAVLLKRPEVTGAFSYTGDAIVAKLTFQAQSGAAGQQCVFSFPQAVYIDSSFEGTTPSGPGGGGIIDLAIPATLPSVSVQ